MPVDLASLLRCLACGERHWSVDPEGVTCVGCGHRYPTADGVLHVRAAQEDQAVRQERDAVLALETGTVDARQFTLRLLREGGPEVRDAFLSLPYGNGSAAVDAYEYFRNVRRFAPVFDYVVRRLGVPAGGRVLDVGADLTWSTSRLAARGWRPVGIDINHHLAAGQILRQHGPDYGVVNVDMHLPAFADAVFDGVTAFNALHHTHRLPELVANLARVVRPGGRLGLVEPYWFVQDVRDAFGAAQIEAGINENVYRLEEWHQTLVNAGFDLVTFLIADSFNAVYEKRRESPRRLTVDEAHDELFARHYAVRVLAPPDVPGGVPAGATIELPVTLENHAQAAWSSEGQIPVAVSYHLSRAGGGDLTPVAFDGLRTPLPRHLAPGEQVEVRLRVAVPDVPGDYVVDVDLVHEMQCWFSEKGGQTAPIRLHVRSVERSAGIPAA